MRNRHLLILALSVVLCGAARTEPASGQGLPQPEKEGIDPIVPFSYRKLGVEASCAEIRKIRAETGLRRFCIGGPGFTSVMFGPFPDDLYANMGRDIAAIREKLADTDIEITWRCGPSIRYFSDFPSIEDAEGNTSKYNKKCPLDEAFAADFTAKVKSVVAAARPKMISIEDDYTLAWGRGLGKSGPCFCRRHLAEFAKRYGKYPKFPPTKFPMIRFPKPSSTIGVERRR